jgi:DNA-binding HxlR family transcriptional regulator
MYAYDAKCLDQVARTMKVVRGKWAVQVLCALLDGPVPLSQAKATHTNGVQEGPNRKP